MIVYKSDSDGGFVVGDTITRHTAYASPTSPYAQEARQAAELIARVMALSAKAYAAVIPANIVAEQNSRNWTRFHELVPNVISLSPGD